MLPPDYSEGLDNTMGVPERSYGRLIALTGGISGVIFTYSLQIGRMTSFMRQLGLDNFWAALVWIGGPLSGFLVQPTVGVWSDRLENRLGRRRPFLIFGAIAVLFAEFLLVFARDIGRILGDTPDEHSRAVPFAVAGFWCLDLSLNTLQGPLRALLGDYAPRSQQALGSAIFSWWIAIGQVAGFFVGSVDWAKHFGWIQTQACETSCAGLRFSFGIGAVVLLVSTACTVLCVKEEPYVRQEDVKASYVKEVYGIILEQPKWFKLVNLVNALNWFGWFAWFMYGTEWVGTAIFRGVPSKGTCPPLPADSPCNRFIRGVELGNLSSSFEAALCALVSFVLPTCMNKLGTRVTWAIGNAVFGAILVSTPFLNGEENKYAAVFLIACLGIPLATTMAVPYTIIGQKAPEEEMGLYMGVRNVFVVASQLLASLLLGSLTKNVFGDKVAPSLALGGLVSVAAAACCMLLESPRAARSGYVPVDSDSTAVDVPDREQTAVN